MLKLRSEEVRLIIILLFAWTVNTEKIYFARYLNTELFPLSSHKVVGDSVSSCIDKCKSSNDCNYINYHVASHLCQLIDGSIGHGVIIGDILVQARGYVFGNKANWTMNVASGCLSCQGDGKCSVNIKKGNDTCPVSGCRPPDSKPDAFIMGNMHGVGNKVKYGCTGELTVAGARQPISTCLESGNWSSTDFQCLLDCGPLPSVEDGTVSLDIPGITTEGARATVFCNPGYAPRNVKIYCQSSGNWDTPLCLQTHNFTCKNGTSWKYASSATCNCVLECSVAENRLCLCTEYQERFISFQNHFILGNNIKSEVENKTDESCTALCRDTLGCKSTDMSSALCYLNTVMPHEVLPGTSETTTLSLRMCDPCN